MNVMNGLRLTRSRNGGTLPLHHKDVAEPSGRLPSCSAASDADEEGAITKDLLIK